MTTKIPLPLRCGLGPEEFSDNEVVRIPNEVDRSSSIFARCQDRKENMLQYEMTMTMTSELRGTEARGKQSQILIIEDDPQMQKVLQRTFRDRGYAITICGDGLAGLAAFHITKPAAVMLDLILPNFVGRELCKTMKAEQPEIPVIVVSGISEVVDKVLLLELGADDYVTKPFSPRELLARLEGALRRRQKPGTINSTSSVGECEIDFVTMTAHLAGKPLLLTAHEFKLLRYFLDNAERVLSREELLDKVWGYSSYPATRTVDNQILKLRQKLEPDSTHPRYLQTVHGAGYKLVP
jgi:DNA-binding response OmpR family regulator